MLLSPLLQPACRQSFLDLVCESVLAVDLATSKTKNVHYGAHFLSYSGCFWLKRQGKGSCLKGSPAEIGDLKGVLI